MVQAVGVSALYTVAGRLKTGRLRDRIRQFLAPVQEISGSEPAPRFGRAVGAQTYRGDNHSRY
jgi:hypothetical protein